MPWAQTAFALVASCLLDFLPVTGARPEAPFYSDKTNLLIYRDSEGKNHSITSPDQWEIRRRHILTNMQEVMGPLPAASHKVSFDAQVSEETATSLYVRKKLTFAVESNDRVPAYLLIPRARKTRLPAVLCLHQTI